MSLGAGFWSQKPVKVRFREKPFGDKQSCLS